MGRGTSEAFGEKSCLLVGVMVRWQSTNLSAVLPKSLKKEKTPRDWALPSGCIY